MPPFASQYTEIFDRFGYPLSAAHGISDSVLDRTAERLGCSIPEALRSYYEVAGKEKRFNLAFQQILPPARWSLAGGHLVFIEESQGVCNWGVSVKSKGARDPGISQGFEEETDEGESTVSWHPENARCSTFIKVLLHYQAVSGGYRFCGGGTAPEDVQKRLKRGWTFVGEVSELWAYSRPNQVVCIMSGAGLIDDLMIMAGGKTAKDLAAIGESLGITFA